jgi:hypothetical protein
VCQPCDVCGSGCYYATPTEAVTDPAGPTTIRICAGDYRGGFTIRRDVQLIGAGDGDGAGDTILTGTGILSVVTILQGLHVTLRGLRITGGEATGNGGGILVNGSQVTLRDCTVTGNRATFGGGILNTLDGLLTLDHTHVTANTGYSGGGIYNNIDATLILINGSHITGNRATQPYGNTGGGILNGGVLHPVGGSITNNTPDDCIDDVNSGTGCPPR